MHEPKIINSFILKKPILNLWLNKNPFPELQKMDTYRIIGMTLTNLIVAVCCTVLLKDSNSGLNKFFSKRNALTAIVVYITIVGLVYNTILRFLWKPEGLQWLIDELLHSVIPFLFIVFWLFFVEKGKIPLKNVLAWLLYPLIYLIYILIRGAASSFYPYPFIDVEKIGYNKTLINSSGMLVAFLAVSILFVALNRLKRVNP